MGFTFLLVLLDALVIAAALVGAYFFRFGVLPMPSGIGTPAFEPYLYPLPVVIVLWLIVLKALGLYGRRGKNFGGETVFALLGAVLLGSVFFILAFGPGGSGGFRFRRFLPGARHRR